jgi:FkbM family methyltransferase
MDIRDENGIAIDINTVEKREQDLAQQYIEEGDTVLELGARYGSVSCVTNSKLKCKTNHVVVEPDARVWDALERNKNANNCGFHIIKGFVSSKKLGLTYKSDAYATTFKEDTSSNIPSYSLEEIEAKYNLKFNVLVADCEGFLGVFFKENPSLYDSLRMITFETDGQDSHPECDYEEIEYNLFTRGFVPVVEGAHSLWLRSENI